MSAARFRHLCLFTSEALRSDSCFAGEPDGWIDRTEAGTCEFLPHVLDLETPALAVSRLFSAATVLVSPDDLGERDVLAETCRAFESSELPFEILAAARPLALVGWIAERAPALVVRLKQDGDVRPDSPNWWRQRVERFASSNGHSRPEQLDETDVAGEFEEFLARRR